MPDEEIKEDFESVSNDNTNASENQEPIVSIITRFLSLDKKCQKLFMSFLKDNHGDKLSGIDTESFPLKIESRQSNEYRNDVGQFVKLANGMNDF